MGCTQVEINMPEGYKKKVNVCKTSYLPRNVKGATNKRDLILINEYLDDLGIKDPELYVWIHERRHMQHPEKGEYKIRLESDEEYYQRTGEKINTAGDYLRYANSMRGPRISSGFD